MGTFKLLSVGERVEKDLLLLSPGPRSYFMLSNLGTDGSQVSRDKLEFAPSTFAVTNKSPQELRFEFYLFFHTLLTGNLRNSLLS